MTNTLIALNIGTGASPISIQAPPVLPTGDILGTILTNAVTILIVVAIALSLFFIIVSGIKWTTSGGDEKQVEAARSRLKYAVLGLIVALSSFFIIQFIAKFFGVSSPLNFNF